MRTRKYLLLAFFIVTAVFPLGACRPSASEVLDVISSATALVPTDTATPVPSPLPTLTSTPVPPIAPTMTVTLFFNPTATPTAQWASCPGIVITLTDTRKGDMLHVLRCDDGMEYNLGPLAKGVYAVGPNDKFLVYVTIDGIVYAAGIGKTRLYYLYNLRNEHEFSVFNKKVSPDFQISFVGEEPLYKLILFERNYHQQRDYQLPLFITH